MITTATVEIDDDEIIYYITRKYGPEEVFHKSDLEYWAEYNDYIKEQES